MYFSNSRKVQWWKLENHSKLDTILPLLSLDYTEEDEAISLEHGWYSFETNIPFNKSIKNFKVDQTSGRFLPVLAKIDLLQVKEDWLDRVPKEIAIAPNYFPVIFVECNGAIHVIVSAASNCFSRIRTKIMKICGKNNIWGRIEAAPHNLDRSFFYWLMYKKGNQIKLGVEDFVLKDVVGFRSSTEKNKHKYKGSGQGIDTEVPVQAMVCLNNNFSGLDLVLTNTNSNIVFSLAENWEVKVEFTKCHKLNMTVFESFDDCELLLKIFLQIIPGMVQQNNADKLWPQQESRFRQNVGLKAIKEIMEENGITMSHIQEIC